MFSAISNSDGSSSPLDDARDSETDVVTDAQAPVKNGPDTEPDPDPSRIGPSDVQFDESPAQHLGHLRAPTASLRPDPAD